MNYQEAVTFAVTTLAEAFNRTTSEGTFQAYEWGLEGLSASEVEAATSAALRQCRFMPSPVELRDLASTGGSTVECRALAAWHEVATAVPRYGRNKTCNFADPLINAAIRRLGGWVRLCDQTEEDFDTWRRRDFIAEYTALVRSTPDDAELYAANPGVFLRENGFHHPHDQPIGFGRPLRQAERLTAQIPRVEFRRP